MKGKMWEGRFSKAAASRVNDFNSSISFDSRMYKCDIEGSIAHATMLGECGIIEKSEAEKITSELKNILSDMESGKLSIDTDAEDIHMFVEAVLTERLGETGKRLHTARSRNDQVALDTHMYLKGAILDIKSEVLKLLSAISSIAKNNIKTVMPGYTHLQHAQPVTFAHQILAYAQMFMRDCERLDDTFRRTDVMPLGSGALASTTYPIDRHMTAKLLGFSKVTENSIDGVSDRDFVAELCFDISMIMMHLSRFSEEIILWCSSEFSYIELDDAYSTGSSIMPQKKNPDIAELVRGKTGRTYGNLTTILTMLKGIPLAYNKDMQEDKEAVFDSIDNVLICLELFRDMISTMTVNRDSMRKSASRGFINATDCADYLVKRGMAFRDAYKITGRLVALCIEENCDLETLHIEKYKKFSELFDEDIYTAVSPETCVNERKVYGGPGEISVNHQIELLDEFIKNASNRD